MRDGPSGNRQIPESPLIVADSVGVSGDWPLRQHFGGDHWSIRTSAFLRAFAQKDQAAQKFDGTYTMEGNVLALERAGGGSLVAEITPAADGKFNFKMVGAPEDDQGLTFQK